MTSAPISEYTPQDALPEPGTASVHPAFDTAFVNDILRPDYLLWTPSELRDLSSIVTSELTSTLLSIAEVDPLNRWWARLGLTAGVELWLLTWAPGQGTKPHDHGGASGAFSVLFGELAENYRYPAGPIRQANRATGESVGFGRGRAHKVTNVSAADAASVHAYSPPLLPVRHYADLSDVPPVPPPEVLSNTTRNDRGSAK